MKGKFTEKAISPPGLYLKQAILKWKFSLIKINARSCSKDDVPALFALETAVFGRFLVPAPVRTASCQEAKRAAIGSIENFSLNTKHIEKNGFLREACATSNIWFAKRAVGTPKQAQNVAMINGTAFLILLIAPAGGMRRLAVTINNKYGKSIAERSLPHQ